MPALKFGPWITISPTTQKPPPRRRRSGCRAAVPQPDLPPQDRWPRTISIPRRSPPRRTTRRGCRRLRGDREAVAEGPLARRPRRDRACGAARPDLARRLSHAECGKRRALCRQGEKCPQAACVVCAGERDSAGADSADDRGHRYGRDRVDADRDRGAAARGQPDQAVAAALQRSTARRQVVSLHSDHRRSLGASDPQASRGANAARTIFWAVRFGGRGQPDHHGATARVSGALMHRFVL